MNTREPGFYWVLFNEGWIVAEWHPMGNQFSWYIPGSTALLCDNDFLKIDEDILTKR